MSFLNALYRDKRESLISVVVLLLVLLLAGFLVMEPLLRSADRYRAELRKDARVLQELRAIEVVQDEIKQAQQSYEERNLQNWAYVGKSIDEVSLDIQKRITAWFAGVQVQRTTPFSRVLDEAHMAVGVDVQFSASLEELVNVLGEIEQGRPLLMVERMRINPLQQHRGFDNANEGMEQRVNVHMLVQTYIAMGDGQ